MTNHAWQKVMAGVTGAALCTLAGCAAAVPQERLQSSAAAIRAAEEVGAQRVPQAALHLQLAKEQDVQAHKMIKDGDREEAALVLTRAEADANLAVALARNAQEAQQAQVAADKVNSLKSQNGDIK